MEKVLGQEVHSNALAAQLRLEPWVAMSSGECNGEFLWARQLRVLECQRAATMVGRVEQSQA